MAILHETKFISTVSMLILPLFISQWDSFHDWSFCLKKTKEITFFPGSLKISLENNVSNFEDPLTYVTHLLFRKEKKEKGGGESRNDQWLNEHFSPYHDTKHMWACDHGLLLFFQCRSVWQLSDLSNLLNSI